MHSGGSTTEAALLAGVSENAALRWVKQAGYVYLPWSNPTGRSTRAPLSFSERCRLEELLETGYTPERADGLLQRHRDTISRELVRGATDSGYRARVGQDVAEAKRKRPTR